MYRILYILILLALCAPPSGGGLFADPVPEQVRGIYTAQENGTCGPGEPVLLLNGAMLVVIERNNSVAMGGVELRDGNLLMTRGPDFTGLLRPVPLAELGRCARPPALLGATLGEAIAVFWAMDDIIEQCSNDAVGGCVETLVSTLVSTLDVSGDDRLSAAEISRAIRAVSVYFSYEAEVAGNLSKKTKAGAPVADTDALVPLSNIYGATAAFSIAAPFVVTSLLNSYDYDGDGFLDAAEILQDREDLDLDALMLAVGSRLGEEGVRGVISALTGMVSGLGGALMPMIMGMR